jgi:hypothetical protein
MLPASNPVSPAVIIAYEGRISLFSFRLCRLAAGGALHRYEELGGRALTLIDG